MQRNSEVLKTRPCRGAVSVLLRIIGLKQPKDLRIKRGSSLQVDSVGRNQGTIDVRDRSRF